jgi:hypothetical protein
MPARRQGGNRQPELFARSKRPTIALPDNHPMVVLTNTVDWTEMEMRAEKIRAKKLKNAAGRPPQLRATLGALTLMAIRKMPYREAEEQIRYYAPARYLCGLTETDWTPDFTTIQDFAQLLGEDGCRLINEAVVKQAVALGLADAKVAVADMTVKCNKYGFNRPAARSAAMMGLCGQRAVLGMNLTKLLRGAAGRRGIALAV